MGKALENALERRKKMSYRNFNVAVYVPVGDVLRFEDTPEYEKKFSHVYDNIKVGRVYIENYRSQKFATKEQVLAMKNFFERKGIACSGGITTCDDDERRGFASLCYTNEKHRKILSDAVAMNAEIFDEIIFDDFYFLNCRCENCIKAKKNRSWSEFRLAQKEEITKNLVMDVAKKVNPDCNVIVKYPQWFEVHNETGYDIKMEPAMFDSIYTGTETRNPTFSQQALPKYLSYFIMRYLDSSAPGRNLGGWFDPYDCSYNLTSYLEQAYLTLFSKTKEVTLFCLYSIQNDPSFRLFANAVGELFEEMDEYLGILGNPVGIPAYRPHNGRGEDNVHSYFGMCGLPFEPTVTYPDGAKTVFLAEGAAYDDDIINKMKKSLHEGADVIVTTGFLRKMGDAFSEFANVTYSSRKAIVSKYADTKDHGLTISGCYTGDAPVLIPQIDYCTNDVWELAAGYGTDNNFPIVLRWCYDNGRVCVITVPDNMGDMYHYPREVLNVIRGLTENTIDVTLDASSGVQMFMYDNDYLIVRSDLNYDETVVLNVPEDVSKCFDIVTTREYAVKMGKIQLRLQPQVNYVLKMER